MIRIQESPLAGSWYPADPGELNELLARLFETSEDRTGPALLPGPAAFVVPHAGLAYSGTVAASVYRHIRKWKPSRAVILAFSHSHEHKGVLMPDADACRTPLGLVEIDSRCVDELACAPMYHKGVLSDHSLEVQLPFLREAHPDIRVVPLYVGRMDEADRAEAARELIAVLDSETVLIASSDFTHYGSRFYYQPFPADTRVGDRLRGLDGAIIEAAGTLSPAFFYEELRRTGCTLCGYRPIGMLLETLQNWPSGEIFQHTLDYQTSGEMTGDYEMSVSYASLGYFPSRSFALLAEDQRVLLEAARRTLISIEQSGEPASVTVAGSSDLSRRTGVFVSLQVGDRILGCVGSRGGRQPLSISVPELTAAAALDDPRAEGRKWSASEVSVEICLLTPMKRVLNAGTFHPGEEGAYLEAGNCRALMLPHVGKRPPYSTREGFLNALAHKAGVPARVYAEPETRLFVFRGHTFGSGN